MARPAGPRPLLEGRRHCSAGSLGAVFEMMPSSSPRSPPTPAQTRPPQGPPLKHVLHQLRLKGAPACPPLSRCQGQR